KVDLVDFKIELGENRAGDVFLADEISPDSCRLWDQDTGQKLDKDVFRRDLGSVEEAYQEIAKRLGLN
ncbi:MAG: phosphoribosylaminoimidazolesuccinocarboxamide synthase, partial [Bdellovibrionales bacterium]